MGEYLLQNCSESAPHIINTGAKVSLMGMGAHGKGGARPGAGRKPKPLAEKRRNRVVLNLTDAEHRALRRAAGALLPATYARRVIGRHLGRLEREAAR